MVERVRRDLASNTNITKEAKDASNGRLAETLDRLAAERDRTLALRVIVRERDDRLAFLLARLPEAEQLLSIYRDQRVQRITRVDELAVEQHAMQDGSTS